MVPSVLCKLTVCCILYDGVVWVSLLVGLKYFSLRLLTLHCPKHFFYTFNLLDRAAGFLSVWVNRGKLIGNFCCHLGCPHVKTLFHEWLFTGEVTVLPLRYFQQLSQRSRLLLTKIPPDLRSRSFLEFWFFIVDHLVANICLEVSLTNYTCLGRVYACKQIICLLPFTTKFLGACVFWDYVAVELGLIWIF